MAEWIPKMGRVQVDAETLSRLSRSGLLMTDTRRSRPLWFDGRFLTAQDLQREQTYFLVRQADLAQAAGHGVVRGLWVMPGSKASHLHVEQGFGIALGGERIVLPRDVEVDLGNLPFLDQLNRTLGLSKEPAPPLRTLSGLFVLAARPVEFTANPVGAYPSRLGDDQRVEDGDIVEAVVLTLLPYTSTEVATPPSWRRATAAHELFVRGAGYTPPPSTLPLAMVELDRGFVQWVDPPMVRREMGPSPLDVLGLGTVPQWVRISHFLQTRRMFGEIVESRRLAGLPPAFAASDYFLSLPSAGQLPAACIDPKALTQTYFPPAVQVDLSLIPDDELPCLVEESLQLPPLDLGASEEILAATSVLVLLPLARSIYRQMAAELGTSETALRAAGTRRVKNVRALTSGMEPRTLFSEAAVQENRLSRWQRLLNQNPSLWYVRRRNLHQREDVVGAKIPVLADEFRDERQMRAYLKEKGLANKYTRLKVRASAEADLIMASMLTSRKFQESDTLLRAAVRELEKAKRLDASTAREIMKRYDAEALGEGIRMVEQKILEPETTGDGIPDTEAMKKNEMVRKKLAEAQVVPEIDEIMRRIKPEAREKFLEDLNALVKDPSVKPAALVEFVHGTSRSLAS